MVGARRADPDVVLRGSPGFGDTVEGPALVSQQGFSARYDLDREVGRFSRESHDLFGESVVGAILVVPVSKGGIATSWMLRDMASRHLAPKGLIFHATNPVMVQGAVLANLPIMRGLSPAAHETIQTGDWLRMIPSDGVVEVWDKS